MTVSESTLSGTVIFLSKTCAQKPISDFCDVPEVEGLFETDWRYFMDNRTFGYARVSTREQNEDRQIEALTNFGVSKDNIIIDKCSGKDTEREGYQFLKKQILRSEETIARIDLCYNWHDCSNVPGNNTLRLHFYQKYISITDSKPGTLEQI